MIVFRMLTFTPRAIGLTLSLLSLLTFSAVRHAIAASVEDLG
jgi:hypothetical protein